MHSAVNQQRLGLVVSAWLWCQKGKPVPEAALVTALKPYTPDGHAKLAAAHALKQLHASGDVRRIDPPTSKGKPTFLLADTAIHRLANSLGRRELPLLAKPFTPIQNVDLPALATGLVPPTDPKSLKGFAKLLQLTVCARHFRLDIPLNQSLGTAQLELVKLALARSSHTAVDRIYLKKVPTGELPALVVGPLVGEPGNASANLDKLLAAVSCRVMGNCKTTQLKTAVVKKWLYPAEAANSEETGKDETIALHDAPVISGDKQRANQSDAGSTTSGGLSPRSGPASPGLAKAKARSASFTQDVLAAASLVARRGGPGVSSLGDKVLVHYVWMQYESQFGGMSLDGFKQLLSRHNGDQLALVREDLIPPARAAEFAASEVRTGASSYHYVRVPTDLLGGGRT